MPSSLHNSDATGLGAFESLRPSARFKLCGPGCELYVHEFRETDFVGGILATILKHEGVTFMTLRRVSGILAQPRSRLLTMSTTTAKCRPGPQPAPPTQGANFPRGVHACLQGLLHSIRTENASEWPTYFNEGDGELARARQLVRRSVHRTLFREHVRARGRNCCLPRKPLKVFLVNCCELSARFLDTKVRSAQGGQKILWQQPMFPLRHSTGLRRLLEALVQLPIAPTFPAGPAFGVVQTTEADFVSIEFYRGRQSSLRFARAIPKASPCRERKSSFPSSTRRSSNQTECSTPTTSPAKHRRQPQQRQRDEPGCRAAGDRRAGIRCLDQPDRKLDVPSSLV